MTKLWSVSKFVQQMLSDGIHIRPCGLCVQAILGIIILTVGQLAFCYIRLIVEGVCNKAIAGQLV